MQSKLTVDACQITGSHGLRRRHHWRAAIIRFEGFGYNARMSNNAEQQTARLAALLLRRGSASAPPNPVPAA
jgi:hypothetical protein